MINAKAKGFFLTLSIDLSGFLGRMPVAPAPHASSSIAECELKYSIGRDEPWLPITRSAALLSLHSSYSSSSLGGTASLTSSSSLPLLLPARVNRLRDGDEDETFWEGLSPRRADLREEDRIG